MAQPLLKGHAAFVAQKVLQNDILRSVRKNIKSNI